MIALDYTVVIQIVAFLVFWFLLSKLLFGPFLRLVEERERRTEGAVTEAASLREEGERLRANYERAIEGAREEGLVAKEALLEEGRRANGRLVAEAREEASRMLEMVRGELQSAMQRERELAAREAQALARQIAEKILGRRVG